MRKQITTLGLILFLSSTLSAKPDVDLKGKLLLSEKTNVSICKITEQNDPFNLQNPQIEGKKGLLRIKNNLQAGAVFKQRLDSTVAPGSYKEIDERDEQGREIKYSYYIWSKFDNKWNISTVEEYGYDDNNFNNYYTYSYVDPTLEKLVVKTKKIILYNNKGGVLSYAQYGINNLTKELEGVYLDEFTYDNNGDNLLTQNVSYWNKSKKVWELQEKYVAEYDQLGNMETGYVYQWTDSVSKKFYLDVRVDYGYDNNNKLALIVEYDYSVVTEQLELGYKAEIETDDKDQIQRKTFFVRDNNDWVPQEQYLFTYHSDGTVELLLIEKWDGAKSAWINSEKQVNSFNDLNQATKFEKFTWNTTTDNWDNVYKNEVTYQASGIRETYLHSSWDATNNKWNGQISTTQTNDSQGNLLKFVGMNWDAVGGGWAGDIYIEFTHDYNFSTDQLLTYKNAVDHKNMVLTMLTNKWVSGAWVFNDIATYYYSEQEVVGINETTKGGYKLYPNPAKNTVTLLSGGSSELFEIYNLQGVKLLSTSLSKGNQINIENLNKGTYIYKVNGHQGSVSGKLIKK